MTPSSGVEIRYGRSFAILPAPLFLRGAAQFRDFYPYGNILLWFCPIDEGIYLPVGTCPGRQEARRSLAAVLTAVYSSPTYLTMFANSWLLRPILFF